MVVEIWMTGQPPNPYADSNFHIASKYLKSHVDLTMTLEEEVFCTRGHLSENVEAFIVREDV